MSTQNKMNAGSGDWKEWSKYVLRAIETLEEKVDSLEQKLVQLQLDIKIEVTKLQQKASFGGAILGLVSSIIVSVVSGVIVYFATLPSDKKEQQNPPVVYQQPYVIPEQRFPVPQQNNQPQYPQQYPQQTGPKQ